MTAYELADWDGGPNIGNHTPQLPWESLFQGTGEENSTNSQTSDLAGIMWFLSWLWKIGGGHSPVSVSWIEEKSLFNLTRILNTNSTH